MTPSSSSILSVPRLMRFLNVTVMIVSPDPKIANPGVSVSVTGHGIACSAVSLDSSHPDGPERVSVCE